jgi:succinylglutamate desuccinylase
MLNSKIIIKEGKNSGKNIAILVGIHGNEKPGIIALDNLVDKLEINSGKVYFIYANLEAIKQNKRFIDYNLNRCFLKNQSLEMSKTLEGKTAAEIMQILDKVDICLDLHASNSPDSVPFLIYESKQEDLLSCFPTQIITSGWNTFQSGATEGYMLSLEKIGICFECGYIGDDNSILLAEKAIINFLKFLNMIEGSPERFNNQKKYFLKTMYKNSFGSFKKSKEFADFEEINRETLIGFDGNVPIYITDNCKILFVRDREKINEECFIVLND